MTDQPTSANRAAGSRCADGVHKCPMDATCCQHEHQYRPAAKTSDRSFIVLTYCRDCLGPEASSVHAAREASR